MTGESDVANLTGFPGCQKRFLGAALGKNAIGIVEADDFMMLYQVDVIRLEAFKRRVELRRCGLFGTTVDLCHQKYFLTIAIFQGLPHSHFALAFVVVPAVIHKRDATVDGSSHQANAFVLSEVVLRDVKSTHSDRRNCLSSASERAVKHVSLAGSCR